MDGNMSYGNRDFDREFNMAQAALVQPTIGSLAQEAMVAKSARSQDYNSRDSLRERLKGEDPKLARYAQQGTVHSELILRQMYEDCRAESSRAPEKFSRTMKKGSPWTYTPDTNIDARRDIAEGLADYALSRGSQIRTGKEYSISLDRISTLSEAGQQKSSIGQVEDFDGFDFVDPSFDPGDNGSSEFDHDFSNGWARIECVGTLEDLENELEWDESPTDLSDIEEELGSNVLEAAESGDIDLTDLADRLGKRTVMKIPQYRLPQIGSQANRLFGDESQH